MHQNSTNTDRHKASDVLYVIHKNKDRFLYISKVFAELIGTRIDDSSSASTVFSQALHPEDSLRIQQLLTDLHGTSIEEYRLLRQDGTLTWIRNRIIALPVNAGDIYYVGIVENISQQRTTATTLTRRLNMEQLISDLAKRLIQAAPQQIHHTIKTTIKQIGEAVQADRSCLFQIDGSAGTMSNTYEWCNQGVDSYIDSLQNLPIQDYPWMMEQLLARKVINVADVCSLPREADAERQMLERQNIHSILMAPIFIRSNMIGNIGFDIISQRKAWGDEDILLITILADLIGSAFQRAHDQTKLLANKIRLSMALKSVGDVLFDINITHGTVHVSHKLLENLGIQDIYEQRTILLDEVWQYVHPDDIERLSQSLADALSKEVQTEQTVRLLIGPKTYEWFRIRGQLLTHPLTQDRHLIGIVQALPRTSRILLTGREIEVLYLFAKDLTARGIAKNLGISPHTVNNHISKIYAKLGANSRLEAMLKANSLGLLYL